MKERLDKLVVGRRLAPSRERAKAFIIAGNISVNGETIRSPSSMVHTDARIDVQRERGGYVSRGGIKLEKAIAEFELVLEGTSCIDIGASTGGFTHCLLSHGAQRVVAVDVGKNQLAYSLRKDPRVEVLEGFNARRIDELAGSDPPDVVTIDVSFISLRLILKPLCRVIDSGTSVIALIKPQFELPKSYPGFRGVVVGRQRHIYILLSLYRDIRKLGYGFSAITHSPIRGPKGNIEYLAHLHAGGSNQCTEQQVAAVVAESYEYFSLGGKVGKN
jgi:23S rRNA (cytidine1920-2'-O)/16S rRNA (cytidine1409-2'-O)-methyltransferase